MSCGKMLASAHPAWHCLVNASSSTFFLFLGFLVSVLLATLPGLWIKRKWRKYHPEKMEGRGEWQSVKLLIRFIYY